MKRNLELVLVCFLFFGNVYAAIPSFVHPQGKYYKINGANIWTETLGKGDPLFLISGGPGGAHAGMHNFDALQDSCTLVYVDYFGRGKSDTALTPEEYSRERDI